MIAAIYARKSTEQTSGADEQRSVTRQVAHARAYAERKGWTVDEASVFVDDGISGAEFVNRPGFARLMNALKPRPPFQVLVMSEESRLGREAIETAYALKQLVQAGVRVFFYLEDRERTLDSPTDKIMMSLTAFADELEREKARQRTYDAMLRKARAGHVTGGRVFGYDNVEIARPDGQRSHVERRINEAEACVVRRIFELASRGHGLIAIAKLLNVERAPAPRSQQGRPRGWASSSVRAILRRSLYRGELSWNQSRKRNRWGQVEPAARPRAEWLSIPAPELRIVPEPLWHAVKDQQEHARGAYLRGTGGQLHGRPARGVESKYLLPGLARCAGCSSGLYVKSRSHGRRRAYFYGCAAFHRRGSAVCANSLEVRMDLTDAIVLEAVRRELRPAVLREALRLAATRLRTVSTLQAPETGSLEARLSTVERDLERLTEAIAAGGELQTLVSAVRAREEERTALREQIAKRRRAQQAAAFDWTAIERKMPIWVAELRATLQRDAVGARALLKRLLNAPIRFQAVHDADGVRAYEFVAPLSVGKLLTGLIKADGTGDATTGTSPRGLAECCTTVIEATGRVAA